MNQLAMALEQRDAGIRQSAEHAEDVSPGWGAAALTALKNYAEMAGDFTGEQFRAYLPTVGLSCPVPKATGALFLKAARQGWLEKIGYAKAVERHASPTCVWRLRRIHREAA